MEPRPRRCGFYFLVFSEYLRAAPSNLHLALHAAHGHHKEQLPQRDLPPIPPSSHPFAALPFPESPRSCTSVPVYNILDYMRARVGGGTRARLLNTVAQRDQGYLECRFGSGLKPKRLRVRVRGSRLRGGGSLFFPAHRCVTSASSPLGRGGVPQIRDRFSRKTRRLKSG